MSVHWNQLTRGQLRVELDKRGQETQGTKAALIERLEACLREECPQGQAINNNSVRDMQDVDVTQEHNLTTHALIGNINRSGGFREDSDSNSCVSAVSNVTSEKARLAGLHARAAYLKEKHRLDRQAQDIRAMQETLALEMQIREAAAIETALKTEEIEQPFPNTHIGQYQTLKQPNRTESYFEPEHPNQHRGSGSHTSFDAHQSYELANRLHLPTLEMSTFEGDIGKYRCFIRAFHSNILAKVSSEEEKLHYLYQFTKGRPRDIVSTCLHLPPERGFREALSLLDRRYGSPVQVAAGLVDQLLRFPSIRADDIEGFETFAIQLRGSSNALGSLPHGAGSVDVKTIRLLLEKIPPFLRDKWRVKVDDIEQTDRRQAVFEDFVRFIEREARIAANPSYGRHVTMHGPPQQFGERKAELRSNAKGKLLAGNLNTSNISITCLKCGENHETSECHQFDAMGRSDRIDFIYANRLCFSCLRKNHISKTCRDKKMCHKCQGLHPTALHFDRQESPVASVTSGHLSSKGSARGGAKLQVVTIYITLSGVTMRTSAFLDSGSTHSFISRKLLEALGARPTKTTSVTLSTINADQNFETCIVPHIFIEDLDHNNRLELPPLFVLNRIPVTNVDAPNAEDLNRWPYLIEEGVHIDESCEGEVGLLIGNNVVMATEPIKIVSSQNGGPFAIRTRYGWILGGVEKKHTIRLQTHQIQLNDEEDLYGNRAEYRKGPSAEDIQWHSIVESSCKFVDGHYEIALPFRNASQALPNNRLIAVKRLEHLKRKFLKNIEFAKKYTLQINTLLEKGYAEYAPVLPCGNSQGIWFLPHHGVEHPTKDKLRVVFDCACEFGGTSLNAELLQGPDFTNSLTDVLLRFRQEPVAFIADIESMFLQVKVPEYQRDYLRFLWWPNGDVLTSPKEYRMTVHLFGATSSPSCSNFALRRTAADYGGHFEVEVAQVIFDRFYVDDCLATRNTEEDAIKLAVSLKRLCARGGFNLTKFLSNSITVLKAIPEPDRSPSVLSQASSSEAWPTDRALGVGWNVDLDTLGYQIDQVKFTNKPLTRRGMLSATAALYDPLGLAAPYVMQARMILQELTRLRLSWDEPVPEEHCELWKRWVSDLPLLAQYNIPRCLCPGGLSTAAILEIHHFSDASERGYGVVSYIRAVDRNGQVSCQILLSRSHLAPLKALSIPRLELSAATLAVKVNLEVERAMKFELRPNIFFWTDSTAVLKYVKNKTARFHVFVSNRLAIIRDGSSLEQWRWVPSEHNPADILSRGCEVGTLFQESMWAHGPAFLQQSPDIWPQLPELAGNDDLEIKVNITSMKPSFEPSRSPVERLAAYFSSWLRLKRSVAWIRRITTKLMNGSDLMWSTDLTLFELESAERRIIEDVQSRYYEKEIQDLVAGRQVQLSSSIAPLDPILDNGLLRVGGRLRHATDIEYDARHPIIMPNADRVTELIIRFIHERVGHEGRQHVLAELRKNFWVIKANAAVRKYLQQCTSCRRRIRPTESQKMADLPSDRVQPQSERPWVSTGVDFFGPFYTKRGRAQIKRYGVIFTCLAIRAVHLEVAESLSTDSFLCAFRRFIARRGAHVRIVRSDNGTNFVGADRELKKEVEVLREHASSIYREAINRGIEWRWNPPGGSHFGGIWERLIRSVRKILNALLCEQTFSDETLYTFLCETESIINNRPLLPVTSDPRDQVPLTPNHFLHLSSVLLPGSEVTDSDAFSKKSWRRAAFLSEQFWRRWRTEYLPLLQKRPRSCPRNQTNLQPGDVVLVVDHSVPRGVWPIGRIEEVKTSADSRVRAVKVRCRGSLFWRPINKLVKITEDSSDGTRI